MRWKWPRKISATYKLEGRVNPIQSDLYQNVPFKKYDLIITNPPYVNSASMSKLPHGIPARAANRARRRQRRHGPGAQDCRRRGRRLTADGILMVEIGNEREYAEAAFGQLGLTWLTTSNGDDMVFLLTADQLKL
jgi:ribosomal protein L3 glutamine methyltransferase